MRYVNVLLVLVIAGLFIAFANFQFGRYFHHDVSWYLISTRWWFEGVAIYEEIRELNPPLTYYLMSMPVALSTTFDIDANSAMVIFLLITTFIAVCWGGWLLFYSRTLTLTQVLVFTLFATIGLLAIPLNTLGQREHLMVIFAWPYLMHILSKQDGKTFSSPHRIMIGFVAALGFAIKPHFLLIPLSIGVVQLVQARSIRPAFVSQNVTIYVFCFLYLAASYVLHPAYFGTILPDTVSTYGAYGATVSEMIEKSDVMLMAFAILAIATGLALCKPGFPNKRMTLLILATAFGAFLPYIIQWRGWEYHIAPFRILCWAAAGVLIVLSVQDIRRNWAPGVIATFAAIVILWEVDELSAYKNRTAIALSKYVGCVAEPRSYQVFASNVYPSFPVGNITNAEPANRSPALWRLPGAAIGLSVETDEAQRDRLHSTMERERADVIEDMLRVRPKIVIVDIRAEKSYFGGVQFEYLDYFQKDPTFAEEWGKYVLIGTERSFDIYLREGENCNLT